jgi:hypothetical protein
MKFIKALVLALSLLAPWVAHAAGPFTGKIEYIWVGEVGPTTSPGNGFQIRLVDATTGLETSAATCGSGSNRGHFMKTTAANYKTFFAAALEAGLRGSLVELHGTVLTTDSAGQNLCEITYIATFNP